MKRLKVKSLNETRITLILLLFFSFLNTAQVTATPPPPPGAPPGLTPSPPPPPGAPPALGTPIPPERFRPGDVDMNGTNSDPCPTSTEVDKRFSCQTTKNTLQGAQITNMVTQIGGQIAVSTLGQQAQYSAMTAGTQSAALESAATTQKQSSQMMLGVGSVQTLLGLAQMQASYQHTKQQRDLIAAGNHPLEKPVEVDSMGVNASMDTVESSADAGYVNSKNKIQAQMIEKFDLNKQLSENKMHTVDGITNPLSQSQEIAQRESDGKGLQKAILRKTQGIGSQSGSEQDQMSSASMMGGMQSLLMGGMQLMNGASGMQAAKQLEKQAKALKSVNIPNSSFSLPTGGNSGSPAQTASAPTSITGDGNSAASTTASPTPTPTGPPMDLGNPFNPIPMNSGVPMDPNQAGQFNVQAPQPIGGNSGNGGMGVGGSTAAATPTKEETQAKQAPNEKTFYQSGGAVAQSSNTKGGSGGAEGGPDLSKLLEKLLPHEEDKKPHNEILTYGETPIGVPNYSPLARDQNIFVKVSEEYKELSSHNRI